MPRQSKRTSAPAPMETPSSPSPPRPRPPPPGAQRVPPSAAPSMFAPDTWCSPCPPQSMVPPSTTYWMPGSSPQGPWWTPPSSANMEQSDLQVWGVDSNPPGGFLNFLNKNTPKHVSAQAVNNGSSSQPINVGDDSNGSDCPRTEKRMLWRKDEDITLVGGWLNNSSDPIHANYKKNDQYWKEVTAAYNIAIPKNRARLMKCIKDRFGRIKKGCMVL